MEYEIFYKLNGEKGVYYVTIPDKPDSLKDKELNRSLKCELKKGIGFKDEDNLEVISINLKK
jgi:hypothetical protein